MRKKFVRLAAIVLCVICSAAPVAANSTPSPTRARTEKTVASTKKKPIERGVVIDSSITDKRATIISIRAKDDETKSVTIDVVYDQNGKSFDVTDFGKRKKPKGVFNSKDGQKIKEIIFDTKADSLRVNKKAFKGSMIERIIVKCKEVYFRKNSFKGTKAKQIELTIDKASQIRVEEGSFNGLDKITVLCNDKEEAQKAVDEISTIFDGMIISRRNK